MPPTQPHLQVIVPCYNPQPDWAQLLADRCADLRQALDGKCTVQLILVNDGSTQGVHEADVEYLEERESGIKYIFYAQNKGKGAALRVGIEQATAAHLLVTDVDFPYTTPSMVRVAETLLAHGGIVSGHREETYYDRVPWFRRLLSKSLRLMLKYLMRLPVTDSQCGLKAMDMQGRVVFLQTTIDRYLFDLEFLQKASKLGVTVRPVSVELREGVVFTAMGLRVLRTEFANFVRLLVG